MAAMNWLSRRTNDGAESLRSDDLLDFTMGGKRFRLMDAQRGIRKPAELTAALSIRTVYSPVGHDRPYDDQLGPDGLLRYKWRGADPEHPENRALRAAMEARAPLIWFVGVGPGRYQPVFPMYLLWEEPKKQQFIIDPDVARGLVEPGIPVQDGLKRYILQQTKQRLHQPVFRATVLRAYGWRCAVCSLRHSELLDAAHIVADRLEEGIPVVRNGLAMCKIHHAAYDQHILGIRPDSVVEIRPDILTEIDGPMLEYGLQATHGQQLMIVPMLRSERPDADLLEISYRDFRAAA